MTSLYLIPLLVAAAQEVHATEVTAPAQAPAALRLSPASEYRVVALMPLSSLGSTDDAVDAVQRVLVGEFRKILGDRLVTPAGLLRQDAVVKSALHSCEGVVFCLIEVVGGLGWDAFVVGNVAGLGDNRVINLKLIDVRSGREVRRSSEKASGDESELITRMRKAAVELVAPELFTGTLELQVAQPGVRVLLDGQLVGVTPLAAPRIEVQAGRHALEASGEGLVPFSTMVAVAYDETKQVTISLPRSTAFVGGSTPFRHRWWTWAIMGAGAVGLGLGGYFNYIHADAVDRIEQRAGEGRLDLNSVDLFQDKDESWDRAVIFYGVGGGLVGVAGVLLAFDLF